MRRWRCWLVSSAASRKTNFNGSMIPQKSSTQRRSLLYNARTSDFMGPEGQTRRNNTGDKILTLHRRWPACLSVCPLLLLTQIPERPPRGDELALASRYKMWSWGRRDVLVWSLKIKWEIFLGLYHNTSPGFLFPTTKTISLYTLLFVKCGRLTCLPHKNKDNLLTCLLSNS